MSTNSNHSTAATPPVRLNSTEESLIQITFKLKKVVFDVCL